MKKIMYFIAAFAAVIAFTACDTNGEGDGNGADTTAVDTQKVEQELSWEKGGLKVYAYEESPEFPDAKLMLDAPEDNAELKAGKTKFNFTVENYTLGDSTEGHRTNGLAFSPKGQHIHFILDNEPYSAHYEPSFEKELSEGHHVMLAFLARSYHESVKNDEAYIVRQFTVGKPSEVEAFDMAKPHMFYSRPKGTYKQGEYNKLLLDFFLMNTDLSPEGNKVRATINGNEFMLTKWVPYVIEGLQAGTTTIKLELLDADGNLVESPFNPVERQVTLEGEATAAAE